MERDAQRKSVRYTLRVQDVLNGMDDEAKENFRSGANGAVVSCPTIQWNLSESNILD